MGTDEVTARSIAEAFNDGRGATSVYCPKDQVVDLQRALKALGIEAVRSTYQTSIVPGVLLLLSEVNIVSGVQAPTEQQRAMAHQEHIV